MQSAVQQFSSTFANHSRPIARIWICVVALLLVMAVTLLIRRVMGAFSLPAATGTLSLVALVAVATIFGLRVAWLSVEARETLRRVGELVPALAVVVLGLAVTGVRGWSWTSGGFWLLIAANEVLWWGWIRARWFASDASTATAHSVASLPPAPHNAFEELEEADAALLAPETTQQLTRSGQPDVGESIYGVLRASFRPQEAVQQLHVAFCPPLASVPEVQAFVANESDATIKVADVQTFGMRLEVRFATVSDEPREAVVEFTAEAE